jgi:hypothetical protein
MSRANEEFLTAEELAKQLKVSVAAIRVWQRRGLPNLPVGRLRRYSLLEVTAWLRMRERKSL